VLLSQLLATFKLIPHSPSHAYQATFETNPDWTQYYSSGSEIWKYFKHIAVKYDAEKYITFNTKIVEARWQEDKSMWKVSLENVKTGKFQRRYDLIVFHMLNFVSV
jgi:cation diffusion facilitator CzcD-associated flavoprotein CzcO